MIDKRVVLLILTIFSVSHANDQVEVGFSLLSRDLFDALTEFNSSLVYTKSIDALTSKIQKKIKNFYETRMKVLHDKNTAQIKELDDSLAEKKNAKANEDKKYAWMDGLMRKESHSKLKNFHIEDLSPPKMQKAKVTDFVDTDDEVEFPELYDDDMELDDISFQKMKNGQFHEKTEDEKLHDVEVQKLNKSLEEEFRSLAPELKDDLEQEFYEADQLKQQIASDLKKNEEDNKSMESASSSDDGMTLDKSIEVYIKAIKRYINKPKEDLLELIRKVSSLSYNLKREVSTPYQRALEAKTDSFEFALINPGAPTTRFMIVNNIGTCKVHFGFLERLNGDEEDKNLFIFLSMSKNQNSRKPKISKAQFRNLIFKSGIIKNAEKPIDLTSARVNVESKMSWSLNNALLSVQRKDQKPIVKSCEVFLVGGKRVQLILDLESASQII